MNDNSDQATIEIEPTRRADVDARHIALARVLAHAGCDWCLAFDPANIRWLTAGMDLGDWFPSGERPVLFHNLINRSVVCSSLDTQALFDNDLDGLGFSIKEYPWNVERESYLQQLMVNRKVASDRHFQGCVDIGEYFRANRRALSAYETQQYRELGRLLAHALEATARNISPGETEAEIGGQLAHRLVKHGAAPAAVHVLADDRPLHHPRGLPTDAPVVSRCLVQATACKFGLFASASRTVCFGAPDPAFRETFDQACRLQAILRTKALPGLGVADALRVGQAYLMGTPYEHDWRRASFGWRIGRSPMEARLSHLDEDAEFREAQPLVWEASLGSARVLETVIPGTQLETSVTGPMEWPARRVRLPERSFALPDCLVIE